MRVLMVTSSGWGRFGPLLPFAEACRRAGHEVAVAAPRSFSAEVDRAGYRCWECDDIDPVALAVAHERVFAAGDGGGNRAMVEIAADLAPRAALPGLLAAIDGWRPDVVLRESGELGSFVAAELRDVPQVQVLIGLDKWNEIMLPLAAPVLAALRSSVGLEPDEAGARLRAVPALSLLPGSFEERGGETRPPVRRFRDPAYDRRPPALPAWWAAIDDPLVYVTFGTVAAAVPAAAAAFAAAVEALAELPVRLVVTTGGRSRVEGLPRRRNVHVESWLPQHLVMGHAAVVVAHGGAGTVVGALSAGVPLVVVPQFADQPDNAARVVALGAGVRVGDGPAPADPAEVRAAARRVLDEPWPRAAARALAAEIRALPPASAAVDLLVDVAGGLRA